LHVGQNRLQINMLTHPCMTPLHSLLPVKCSWQLATHKMLEPTYTMQHSNLHCCCLCVAIATLHCFRHDVCPLWCVRISPAVVMSNYAVLAEAVALARLLFWNRPAWHRVVPQQESMLWQTAKQNLQCQQQCLPWQ